jgi:hypothetical protein
MPVGNEEIVDHWYQGEGADVGGEVMILPKSGIEVVEQDDTVKITLDEETAKALSDKSFESSVESLKQRLSEISSETKDEVNEVDQELVEGENQE